MYYIKRFLGALVKLLQATTSFVMSDRPSVAVRKEQVSFNWTDFHEI